MKILHISDYFSSKLGYQEFNLAKCHALLGHSVTVISSDRYYPFPDYDSSYKKLLGSRIIKGRLKDEDRQFGYRIVRVGPLFEYAKSAFIFMPNLLPFINTAEPDLIVSHDIISPSTLWACFYKRKHPATQLVFDTHAAEYNTNFNTLVKKTYLFLWKIFIRGMALKYADKIIAIGKSEKEFAEKHLLANAKTDIEIVPLGTDVAKFSFDSKAREQLRKNLGIKSDDIVFVNAGKINDSKKNLDLLKIFIKLYSEKPNVKLLFVGGGDKDYIANMKNFIEKQKIKGRVIFSGMVQNDELPLYFSASDIGVWPGSPSNIFYEAMACKLPIIIKKRKDRIIEGNGYAFKNETQLEKAMLKLSEDAGLIDKMGTTSSCLAKKKYSWDSIAKNFIPAKD